MSIELKQAAQQAIEALEWYVENDDVVESMPGNEFWVGGKREAEKAIQELRAAIQQAEAQQPATPEPVHATVRNLLLELLNEPDRTLQQRPDRFRRVREAYELLYTHPAPGVPDGWQLVPIEPTAEMLQAALKVATPGALRAAWARMLAASPAQKGGE